MTIEELLVYAKQYIHKDHAKILLAEIIHKNPLELLLHLDELVSEEDTERFKKQVQALSQGKPLQYVMGYVNFCGIKYIFNNDVLIPRFETEELVEYTKERINKIFTEPVEIIDLGCGSGVIGLTLEKKLSTKTVDLVDISKKALEVATLNKNLLNSNANIIESDFFNNIDKKYDVIISNPPYIKTNEDIEDIVKNNEPHLALYAGEDGLDCYKSILSNINTHMKERCLIAFEIGNTQKNDIIALINKYISDCKIEVVKDMSERDRMIFIYKNIE